MKIVFVAFDCKKDNSVMYKKVEISNGCTLITAELDLATAEFIGKELLKAIRKGADFCSVRFIKENEKND